MSGSRSKHLIGCAAAMALGAFACGAAHASIVTLDAPAAPVDGLQFHPVPPSSAEGLSAPLASDADLDGLLELRSLTLESTSDVVAQDRKPGQLSLDQLPFIDPHAPFLPKAAAWMVLLAGLVGSRAMLRRARQLAVVEA